MTRRNKIFHRVEKQQTQLQSIRLAFNNKEGCLLTRTFEVNGRFVPCTTSVLPLDFASVFLFFWIWCFAVSLVKNLTVSKPCLGF